MRLLKRNLTTVYYCTYKDQTVIRDEDGYETGEPLIEYNAPVALKCNVSPAKGTAQTETFGNLESYDKVIVTDDMSCPIDENTVLFVDKAPSFQAGEPLGYDYKVYRVAKSLNLISIAISKVKVS